MGVLSSHHSQEMKLVEEKTTYFLKLFIKVVEPSVLLAQQQAIFVISS